ncbi:interferon regulatory factor 8-like [Lethenteron reissneri]|uniref:interferon regulatory factor 8-like n=1 Tax=Lethenteron reissneri TaxID=7753 RepID=UPI002AB6AB4F|nr:interferon regulatory factor 8-like [Lethenteron reissneri]
MSSTLFGSLEDVGYRPAPVLDTCAQLSLHGARIPDRVATLPAIGNTITRNFSCTDTGGGSSRSNIGCSSSNFSFDNMGCGSSSKFRFGNIGCSSSSSNVRFGNIDCSSSSSNFRVGNIGCSSSSSSDLFPSSSSIIGCRSSNFIAGNSSAELFASNSKIGCSSRSGSSSSILASNIGLGNNSSSNSRIVPSTSSSSTTSTSPAVSRRRSVEPGGVTARAFRGSARRLRSWIVEQIDSQRYPGLAWEDTERRTFRVPWKHAAKHDYNLDGDSALFKAWAVFRRKHHEGVDEPDPAGWKTRLRCALSKSPDFAEVVERRHTGGARPYKVYRLLPDETAAGISGPPTHLTGASSSPRGQNNRVRNERGASGVTDLPAESSEKRPPPSPYPTIIPPLARTAEAPLPQAWRPILEQDDLCKAEVSGFTRPITFPSLPFPCSGEPLELDVTFFVLGERVGPARRVRNGLGCRVAQGQPPVHDEAVFGSRDLEQLPFPDVEAALSCPLQRSACAPFLSHLERGLVLEARAEGVRARRLCAARVFWTGPQVAEAQGRRPNKLDRGVSVQVFSTQRFCKELEAYARGEGPVPLFESIFCFGEEYPDSGKRRKLLTVHVEPVFARRCCELLEDNWQASPGSFQLSSADSEDELANIFKTLQKLC